MTIYTPAAQRIREWGKGKKEHNSVTAGAAGARETCETIRKRVKEPEKTEPKRRNRSRKEP